MRKLIVATAAAMFLGAPLALAASTTTTTTTTAPAKTQKVAADLTQRCTDLGAQFDKAEATHKTNKHFKEALAMRDEGKTLCNSHKETDGIKKIESALTMIGVKPMKS